MVSFFFEESFMQTAAGWMRKKQKQPLSRQCSLRSSFFVNEQLLGHEKQEWDSVAALHPFKCLNQIVGYSFVLQAQIFADFFVLFFFLSRARDFATTPFLLVHPLSHQTQSSSLTQTLRKKKKRIKREKDYVEVTTPFTTGSLLRYVAQQTRLKVPKRTGNTIRDTLSILLTLLQVFFGSGILVSEARSCTDVVLEMVEMDTSLVRLGVQLTPAEQTLFGFFDSTMGSRFYSGTDHIEQRISLKPSADVICPAVTVPFLA